jgi:putative tryptophan/tyrosine transport system substrate-binding protein
VRRLYLRIVIGAIAAAVVLHAAVAQQPKPYRVGIVREGGPDSAVVDGLREGLKELGFVEGKHYVLETRDLKGDRSAVRAAAESFEREKVDLIYSIATSVTMPVKRATSKTPVVFAVGSDPVAAGLVESLAKPGGRFTGVYYSTTDLTAKRLQVLKAILPNLHKVATFYDPGNQFAVAALGSARDSARQLQVEIVETQVTSVTDLRARLASFKAQDADAFFYINDAMVRSQAQVIIDTMRAKKVPTMFSFPGFAAQGALAGYGVSFRDVGKVSARYVQKVLTGSKPQDLPVESLSRVELGLNINTAREIGVTIPQAVRLSASEVIE